MFFLGVSIKSTLTHIILEKYSSFEVSMFPYFHDFSDCFSTWQAVKQSFDDSSYRR